MKLLWESAAREFHKNGISILALGKWNSGSSLVLSDEYSLLENCFLGAAG
jgi:hypothetical protein